MALIHDVKSVRNRLAGKGWGKLFKAHGLDIKAANLAAEMEKPLPGIQRKLMGFQDFSADGTRGIEPGQPQHSLLYHALASPLATLRSRTRPAFEQTDLLPGSILLPQQRSS